MSDRTEDKLLDDLVDQALADMAARTPEQAAADQAWCARYDKRMATPMRERALAAARHTTGDEAVAAMNIQSRLSVKDTLTDEDKAELRRCRELLEDHPRGCFSYNDLIKHCLDSGIEWLEDYICEETWGWLWWADYCGTSVEEYSTTLEPEPLAYILNHPSYPEGWKPKTRR